MTKTDKIILKDLAFYGHHGLFEEEQKLGQKFYVDAKLTVDASVAGESDRMEDSVHYGEVFEAIKAIVEGEPVHLLEKLATDIAKNVLDKFNDVYAIDVKVRKPSAPIPGQFDYVAVEISRTRTDFA